jgi:hypothetical protein
MPGERPAPEPDVPDPGPEQSDPRAEARPIFRLALITGVLTAVAAVSSRALRTLGDPPPDAIEAAATVLAVASVLLLVTTLGAIVLWVLVRFLSPAR